MNNYFIAIVIIITLFLFSEDKNLIDNIFNNKFILLISIIYFLYNDISLFLILIIILSIILSNHNIRLIIYNRYNKHFSFGNASLKKLLNINENNNKNNNENNIDYLANQLLINDEEDEVENYEEENYEVEETVDDKNTEEL